MKKHILQNLITKQKQGIKEGICSVCSSHPYVIESALQKALQDGKPIIIESTSNQVNQLGGYTGMRPENFMSLVKTTARKVGYPESRLIIGGDHLGPYPFRSKPASEVMAKACTMVRDYVFAGFTKIHLDASMHLGDDREGDPLDPRLSANRCAILCRAAEQACESSGGQPPVYVIGTEVPAPGGAVKNGGPPEITSVDHLEETISCTEEAFLNLRLENAWRRVVAVVVQAGVEFGNEVVFPYDRSKVKNLAGVLKRYPHFVFEGHSTDYQTRTALRQMVEDGIAILKVGPALTFAMREAFFMLSDIERELYTGDQGYDRISYTDLPGILERIMKDRPIYWQAYYQGNENELRISRRYSFYDRIRYYWNEPIVQEAIGRLLANLRRRSMPLTLLSQYMPAQYTEVREGGIEADPEALIMDRIRGVLDAYLEAVSAG